MVRPLAVRRHNEIVQRLRAAGSVSVGELANTFGVSHETIRRDLKLLADQGHLDVVHGGAARRGMRSEEHTSELQSRQYLVCRLLLENKKARPAWASPLTRPSS